MRAALTDLSVRSLRSTGKQTKVWDTRTRGFGVLVSGQTKSWFVCYGTDRRLKTIGRYPDVPLAAARKKALVLLGSTPEARELPSFPEAREQFLANSKLSPRAAYETSRILFRYFNWKKKIDLIIPDDVASVIEQIDAPSEALHAFKTIRTFFNACVPRYLKQSPCFGLKPPSKYTPRHRTLSEQEIKIVWNAAEGMFGNLLRLALLTGGRSGELLKLKWSDITDIMIFRKTKNGKDHSIPLTQTAKDLLASIPKTSDYIFPSGDGTAPYNGGGKAMSLFRKSIAIPHFTFHDLRRTMAHQWQKMGVRLEQTEAALNHVGSKGGIVGVYQTYNYEAELKDCYSQWETRLKTILKSST